MNIRYRPLIARRSASSMPTLSDLALINAEHAMTPVGDEDVHVRQARIAHNQHDRSYERFPKTYLDRFAETLPGKSLLAGHTRGALPLGRWFRADTRARVEEFPVLVTSGLTPSTGYDNAAVIDGVGKQSVVEFIPGFTAMRVRVTWLDAAFFFAADASTDGIRKAIDAGVYQDVSIGFRYADLDCDVCAKSYWMSDCSHYRGQVLPDGRLVTLTYSGEPDKVEALETSIVYLGAQQHAELIKDVRCGRITPELAAITPFGVDGAAQKEYEYFARTRKGQPASLLVETLPVPQPLPSIDGSLLTAAIAAETPNMTEEESRLVAIGQSALEDVRAQYVSHCVKLGQDETEAMAVGELFIARSDYAGLKALADRKFAEVCKRFPAVLSGERQIEERSAPIHTIESVRASAYGG